MKQDRSPMAWAARAQRHGMELPVFVYDDADRRIPALMTDISYEGCQLLARETFSTGEPLTIVHAHVGEVSGRVQWIREGRVGVTFDEGRSSGQFAETI